MKIFPSSVIPEIDKATCEAQNIDSVELMERAASEVSCEIISRFLPGKRIVVIAGPGNNGGDALAVARMLFEQGYRKLVVFLFNIKGKLSHDCQLQLEKLIPLEGIDFTEVKSKFNPPFLGESDVVVDGLFGSGLRQPLQGGFVALARYINESGAYVISIDTPSGLFGEWNENANRRDMVHADLTLAFQTPRLSFFFEENADVVGEWKLLDIDLDDRKMKEIPSEFMLVEARSVRPLLKPRPLFSNKRDFGSALIFAGSTGMIGAAVMAARATLKTGAGLATVHHPHQVIAVGPGIGTNEVTSNALESLLLNCKTPLLLDADALNCIARKPSMLTQIPAQSIITPHAGEFDRLFGDHSSQEARLRKAIDMAKYYNIIIVLKGHYTATVRPTGKVYFNSTGNPGMATAGAGDVLTGVITALLAQGYRPEHAATVGVFIHGLAGDIAAEEKGAYGMTASDIADNVGRAIRMVIRRDNLPGTLQA